MNGAESAPRSGMRGGATVRDIIAGASDAMSRSPSSGRSVHLLPRGGERGFNISFCKHEPDEKE